MSASITIVISFFVPLSCYGDDVYSGDGRAVVIHISVTIHYSVANESIKYLHLRSE